MDTTEQIYDLVKQWCFALDQRRANAALRQIAIATGCILDVPEQLNEKQSQFVLLWLQKNHPNTYLWAMSQFCVGHPAVIWGMGMNSSYRFAPKVAGSF